MGIALAIVSLGCGNAINGASNGWVMLGYTFLALAMFGVSLVLAALGISSENERIEQENRKIKRVAYHTNEWRNAQ